MSRFALVLTLFAVVLLGGCSCTVDHQQQAATAQQRITALERIANPAHPRAVPDEELTPAAFRLLAAKELKTWKVVKARAQEADELPEDAR